MRWVYIIKSLKNQKLYIGSTKDLTSRLLDHNNHKSRATTPYAPWQYVYIEGYADEKDAYDRESKIKQFGRVYAQLKRRIRRSLAVDKVRD